MDFLLFVREHNLPLEILKIDDLDGLVGYRATIEESNIHNGKHWTAIYGQGNEAEKAVADFAQQISGHDVVFTFKGGRGAQAIKVPELSCSLEMKTDLIWFKAFDFLQRQLPEPRVGQNKISSFLDEVEYDYAHSVWFLECLSDCLLCLMENSQVKDDDIWRTAKDFLETQLLDKVAYERNLSQFISDEKMTAIQEKLFKADLPKALSVYVLGSARRIHYKKHSKLSH